MDIEKNNIILPDEKTKVCRKCNKSKCITHFYKDKQKKGGLYSYCKVCCKEKYKDNIEYFQKYHLEYYKNNTEKEIEKAKKYYWENKEEIYKKRKGYRKKYAIENPKKVKKWTKVWRTKNPNYYSNYNKKRRKEDKDFKILGNLRCRLYKALNGLSKSDTTKQLLGCTIKEFKKYIESQFEDGMSWDNNTNDGWHIDHVIPLSLFDLKCEYQQSVAFHWSNCQPMWGSENQSKNNKIPNLGIEIDNEWLQNRGIR